MKILPAFVLIAMTIACSESATTQNAPEANNENAETSGTEATPAAAPVLNSEGYGELHIGMSRDEVTALYGEFDGEGASGLPEPEMCDEYHPERAPAGLFVMLEENVVTRISIGDDSDIRTAEGNGVGDTADAVRTAYGERVDAMPHHYAGPPAEYLDIWDGDARPGPEGDPPNLRGIRFETDEERNVTSIHAGGSSVQYVEGCL